MGLEEDVPAPIPARPVADPGPFAASGAPAAPQQAEAPRPLSADPFAGSFFPSGMPPHDPSAGADRPGWSTGSAAPVQQPPAADPYAWPGPEENGLVRPAGPVGGFERDYRTGVEGTLNAPHDRSAVPEPFGVPANAGPHGSKSFVATWLLAWFLGGLGADRFYLGKIGTGVVKLLTGGGLGVWALYDLFLTLLGHQTAKDGSLLSGYDDRKKLAWIVTVGVWLVLAAAYVAVVVFAVVDLPTL